MAMARGVTAGPARAESTVEVLRSAGAAQPELDRASAIKKNNE
jgi:hypothetical protein